MNLSLRGWVLVMIWIGAVGLEVELLLLKHADELAKLIPHVVLALGIVSIALVTFAPKRSSIRFFQGMMLVFLVVGAVGIVLHLRGNIEFVLERYPTISRAQLFWKALRGATPAFAPAALSQVGLLGLIFTYRHPALTGVIDRESDLAV